MTIAEKLVHRAAAARKRAVKLAKRAWMKVALRGTRFSDNHDRIDLAYKVEDPWLMNTPKERYRFEQTNEIIERAFGDSSSGKLGTMLEVGCGEGHQTEYLSRLCENMYGFDVSATAVERAKTRLPHATFAACDMTTQPFLKDERFDLVVACEVLYYMEDVPLFLRQMSELGRHCLVTYYDGRGSKQIAARLAELSNTETASFRFEDVTWCAVWWSNES